MSSIIRTYLCVVSFVDARRKPRTIVVTAKGRSAARKAARTEVATLHPTWDIAMVQATHESKAEAPAKVAAVVDLTPAPKAPRKASKTKPVPPVRPTGVGSRGGDPAKAAAWARTVEITEAEGIAFRSPEFYVVYKAEKALSAAPALATA